ncbi:C1 family peptidase [Corynebacterium sp. zg-331]|uniref:aminopeptidase C n=1 Tax=unclassified Corynebacterium TaxID=2624378 RepID=UPI00128AE3C3|nr:MULTISPECIES: C1 family peptidase [unclassified Corynebacterium]MBC3185655.1 C1 family peptidase [Corynebacterium sp. zg-331]MPV52149.1 aminopeptidase [Corynebacterium sp. zg331]
MADFTLTPQELARLRESVDTPQVRMATNAVTITDVDEVALDRRAVVALSAPPETRLDSLKVTNQKQSGRCWMFAALNVFRHRIARDLGVQDFEFSEAYLQFYDLLGKAEVFLDAISQHLDDLDDRRAHALLQAPVGDGGEWNYLVHLVERYGAVPKYAMPETHSSSHTVHLRRALNTVLRRGVLRLRKGHTTKEEILRDTHRILVIHLGVPPERFPWQYRDKEGVFHREGEVSPREFASRYLPDDLGDYVVLGHDPRPRREAGVRYAIDTQTNVPGTSLFTYLNAEMPDVTRAAAESVRAGEPVWFACDVNRQFHREMGVWDANLLGRDALYGVDTTTTKAQRMQTWESVLTHAMVLTGYDDSPARWRVENSWGEEKHSAKNEAADKGYGVMSQAWFDQNVFAVAVRPQFVPEHLRAALGAEPRVLPVWDAMA